MEEDSLSSLVPNKKSSFIKDQSRRHKCEIEIDITYSLLVVAGSSRSCNGGQEFELGRPTFKYGAHAVGTCGAKKQKAHHPVQCESYYEILQSSQVREVLRFLLY